MSLIVTLGDSEKVSVTVGVRENVRVHAKVKVKKVPVPREHEFHLFEVMISVR